MHPHPHPPPASPSQAHDRHAGHTPEMFRDRFLVSLLLTLPVLYASEEVRGLLGLPPWEGASWIPLLLGTLIYLYGGGVFLQGALRELGDRRPGMMTLVALGISVAYIYSLAVQLAPLTEGKPFWWELATLVDVMLLGHFLEMKAILGAGEALKALAKLMPQTAHRLVDGRVEDVPTTALREGNLILIRPGEQVPADGVVVEGATSMNEAFLTGESRPVAKGVGDEVLAGALNGEGAIQVRVTRTGTSTTLGQIMRLVEEAQASRSRFQDLGDRAAGWLFYLAVLGGSATFLLWLLADASLSFALERAVTVVVIACPHALGLAIPLVVVNATAMAAQRGILIRNREAFERATGLRYVALDKTGTLTEGRFEVRGVYAEGLEEKKALALAAALEAFSEHPLAEAIREHAKAHLDPEALLSSPTRVQAVPGKGVEGYLGGQLYRVGRPEWAEELGLSLPPYLAQALREVEARGESAVALMDETHLLALFALRDRPRPSAREAIQRLKALGLTPVMVTGDAEAVAKTLAGELGIALYHARVLPQDKARIVRELRSQGPTAFVGDGINDAPALLEADLGVAIGAGTHVAMESADVVLVKSDPLDVVRLLHLARATRGKMLQNLFWATGYNAIALPLAAGVAYPFGFLLPPALGALFMSLSTVVVAFNALLLRRAHLDA
ncbi:heavy metal translocating P-type ATPase [Thermus sp. SYSU G05001]|uniref:Heavy metal translocating P-type ATPase n=1 Tax=Thermus brevis TaxID=2862456 RepID=A0ABS7A187_9DEIN|nr:heavy metal translocating P-type ATPase [Thermus brevis]MBW6396067.1 heavy metal translocating P-type ATPase [Thermus brevis]